MNRSRIYYSIFVTGLALVLLSACGGSNDANRIPVDVLSETVDAQVIAACDQRDFERFFWLFAASQTVRETYTASMVHIDDGHFPLWITGDAYYTFQIGVRDQTFVRVWQGSDSLAPASVRFSEGEKGRYRVDWTSEIMAAPEDDPPDDGDTAHRTTISGYYIFHPHDGCWNLVADVWSGPHL